MERNFSVFLGNLDTCNDRHCPEYSDKKYTLENLFTRAASIDKLKGVDLVATKDLYDNIDIVKENLERTGLKAVSIVVDLFGQPIWKQGSLSSNIADTRKKAIESSMKVMDLAEELGSDFITIWPGQDGYDYMFQADYIAERTWFADGVREACKYKPNVGIALEYKIREPRTHNYINTVGNTILTVKEVGKQNCGIALDTGHAYFAYENSAESVALMKKWGGNLMHIHINDNYSYADDDLIVGSNRTTEYLEFLFWLNKTGFNGWFTMDQFPYREDGAEAIQESIYWLDKMMDVMDKADHTEIEATIAKKDAIASNKLMRKLIFG